MIQEQIFTLSFRPGKGEVSRRSMEVAVGEPLPALPIPQRKDYTFDGWYTEENGKGTKYVPGDVPTTDLVLYAHWVKRKAAKKKSLYRTQKNAAITLAISFAVLIVVLIAVNALVSILTYTEQVKTIGENGEVEIISTKYYVKKIDGVYHLCHLEGSFPNWTFTPLPQDSDGYFVTDRDSLIAVDPETGACTVYAVVETEGSEVVGYSGRVMLFRQLTYDASSSLGKKPQNRIDKIEVTNEHGKYTFIREKDTNDFYIDGYDTTAFNLEYFAALANACGYTLSMERLADPDRNPDGTIRFAEYGLVAETRKAKDENDQEYEYEYVPAKFTVTAGDGNAYTVIIGDAIVSGAGYYVQLEGRSTVYILSASGITEYLLQPLEVLLTPMVSYPTSMNTYFDVEHFIIQNGIDHEKINEIIFAEACKRLGIDLETVDPESIDQEALSKEYAKVSDEMYDSLLAQYSKKVCDFSYLDLEERENTMYSSMSFKTDSEYMQGYFPNYDNVNSALYNLYSLPAQRIIKLDPDVDTMEQYGVLEPAHLITYYYDDTDEEGNTYTVFNRISISAKTSAGLYYAYGEIMAQNEDGEYFYLYTPMIIELYESAVPFLEWSDVDWYDPYFVQLNIAYVHDVIYSWGQNNIHFSIDNSATSQMVFLPGRGSSHTAKVDDKEITYTVSKIDGRYVLVDAEGNALAPIQTSDYMVAGQYVTKGTIEYPATQYARDYMFVEVIEDANTGRYTYYMYFRADKSQGYKLCADIKVLDASGTVIDAKTMIEGQAAYVTDYFYTKSGYLFMLDKSSKLGSDLTEGMGSWGDGTVYVTADDKYILIDNGTGTWFTISTLTPQIYFTDKDTSSMVINSADRNGVTFYPTGNTPLRFNESENCFEIYNVAKKSWAKANTSNVTLGVWGSGAYYKTADGSYILVDTKTGEWGYLYLSTTASGNMVVSANGEKLSYEVILHTAAGKEQNSYAADNFRKMYQGLLYASAEGATDLTEEQMAAFRALPDSECQLKLTIAAADPDGTTRYTIYRFYRYSNLKSYMTIELVDSPDDPGNPQNAQGSFFVLSTFVEKLISDAQKVVDGQEVIAVTKN